MDTPTQALLGGALAQSFLGNKLGRKALVAGLFAGSLADADMLIRSSKDSLLALTMHRHFTHSFVFIPVGALVAAAICYLFWRRKADMKLVYLACLIGYASHAPLDLCTSYGTVILWPFTSSRFSLDCISIVDLVFSIPLLVGCIIAAKKKSVKPAAIATIFAVSYIMFGLFQNHSALVVQRELAERREHTIQHGRAMPTLANLFIFRSVYRAGDRIYADKIMVAPFMKARIEEGDSVDVFTERDLANNPRIWPKTIKDFRKFHAFADGFTAEAPGHSGIVGDMRYSLRTSAFRPLWGISLDLDDAQHPVKLVSLSRGRDFFDWAD